VATCSATFAPPPDTLNPETTHYDQPPTAETRDIQFQREGYKKLAPDPNYWPKLYQKVDSIQWEGFSKEELVSVRVPFLILQGDHDFVRLEHFVETFKLIPHSELAVIPDASHVALSSEPQRVIPIIKHFLEQPEKRLPLATANTVFHPGETR
jgi:pimeloyl-ACP methyl ester carboxylesterase